MDTGNTKRSTAPSDLLSFEELVSPFPESLWGSPEDSGQKFPFSQYLILHLRPVCPTTSLFLAHDVTGSLIFWHQLPCYKFIIHFINICSPISMLTFDIGSSSSAGEVDLKENWFFTCSPVPLGLQTGYPDPRRSCYHWYLSSNISGSKICYFLK